MVLNVFPDYLTDRTQSVKLGNTISDPLQIKISIPQGTGLGTILFNPSSYYTPLLMCRFKMARQFLMLMTRW